TESYPTCDPAHLPMTMVVDSTGAPAHVSIDIPGSLTLHARIWRVDVGRVPLILLDTNVPDNEGELREVTARLYGGGAEQRLQQELLLGVGGMRALELCTELIGLPLAEVFHMNEGHAGFLGVERIRVLMDQGLDFGAAVEAVRA